MKRALKITVIILFAGFVVMQFFRPDLSNPQINDGETLEAAGRIPENVAVILRRSCSDCHTNKTVYPWYAQIAPLSWYLARHIDDGRRKLNFSLWNTYETRRKRRKLDEICEQARAGLMPLPSYLWIHRKAKLSEEEIETLCDWAENESERLPQTQ